MISYQKAIEIANEELKLKQAGIKEKELTLVLLIDKTIHESFGWVFFYTSNIYIETENINHAIAGNAPFIIEKKSGKIVTTGTAHRVDYYIEKYKSGEKW